ncbi:hypothetical protein [Streptomyces cylindrosporus]|uniref:Uncharacterized protein n=1 Tax=Streptomyces cylindrosporus TaxID=2927583 RepID=A0ABS9YB75_9ACTN|nr:hypothetical protein [Streptomyces cylindrosporus]MCI3274472.1 hypothetical protein [Streptomyces cylindrosporus]
MSRRPESERSDWTDLDLLTREEAHGRLLAEIADTDVRLAGLGESDAAERELLESRLRALREAAEDLIDHAQGNGG